jgi:hypothetical protein
MSHDAIEIYVGEISDMEARVSARYRPGVDEALHGQEPIVLRGTLRGPYCERARTLPAEFAFRDLGPGQPGVAEAVVTDPCLWSPELPHLYDADVEAVRGEQVVAAFHGRLGLRRTASQQGDD